MRKLDYRCADDRPEGPHRQSQIAAAAIKLGIGVYRPLSDGGRYDLILDLGPHVLRVQCKWANVRGGAVVVRCYSCRRNPKRMVVRRYTADEVDAIVAYCPETDGCYLLQPEVFDGHRFVHLRIAPSRNNQRLGIN